MNVNLIIERCLKLLFCKDISQLNLQTMKMVMFSSFNFSWNLSSDVSVRCSSHPQEFI